MFNKLNIFKGKSKLHNLFLTAFVLLSSMTAVIVVLVISVLFTEASKVVDSVNLSGNSEKISASTIAKLSQIEKEIIPSIEINKVNSFKNDWLASCEFIEINNVFYSNQNEECLLPANSQKSLNSNNEVKSLFDTIKSFDIVELRSYPNIEKTDDGKYINLKPNRIDFTFVYGLKQEYLVFITDVNYVERENKQMDKDEYKLKQIQGNWYR